MNTSIPIPSRRRSIAFDNDIDINPQEAREWQESIDTVVERVGVDIFSSFEMPADML